MNKSTRYVLIGAFTIYIFARAAGFHISILLAFLIMAVGVGIFWGFDKLISTITSQFKNNKKM